jgi:hypothetical protein
MIGAKGHGPVPLLLGYYSGDQRVAGPLATGGRHGTSAEALGLQGN